MEDEPCLRINPVDAGTTVTVRLAGELAMDCVTDLHTAQAGYVTRPSTHLVLDLAGLEFCDSAGLGAIVGLRRRVVSAGGTLTLTGVGGQVARLLEYTGLSGYLGIQQPAAGTSRVDASRVEDARVDASAS